MICIPGRQLIPHPFHFPIVTIGNFDGVHRGHQTILQLTHEKAKEKKGTSIVYTFRPHPQAFFCPDFAHSLLTPYDEKLKLIETFGIHFLIEEPFDLPFSRMDAQQFLQEILIKQLKTQCIIVGHDFTFGHSRAGQLELLKTITSTEGIELIVVHPNEGKGPPGIDQNKISSSHIRKLLQAGEVDQAHTLLGREFSYQGTVIRGEGRGKLLGYPTANFQLPAQLILPYGVYATWTFYQNQRFPSITHIGVRPTFQSTTEPSPAFVETHLLQTTLNLYDQCLEVRFVQRLREEIKFPSIHALKTQLVLDSALAEKCLNSY